MLAEGWGELWECGVFIEGWVGWAGDGGDRAEGRSTGWLDFII